MNANFKDFYPPTPLLTHRNIQTYNPLRYVTLDFSSPPPAPPPTKKRKTTYISKVAGNLKSTVINDGNYLIENRKANCDNRYLW